MVMALMKSIKWEVPDLKKEQVLFSSVFLIRFCCLGWIQEEEVDLEMGKEKSSDRILF